MTQLTHDRDIYLNVPRKFSPLIAPFLPIRESFLPPGIYTVARPQTTPTLRYII